MRHLSTLPGIRASDLDVPDAFQRRALAVAGKHRYLRMKHTAGHGHRLDFVVFPDALRSLFAQARAEAVDVGKNESLLSAAAYQGVEDDRLEEREA